MRSKADRCQLNLPHRDRLVHWLVASICVILSLGRTDRLASLIQITIVHSRLVEGLSLDILYIVRIEAQKIKSHKVTPLIGSITVIGNEWPCHLLIWWDFPLQADCSIFCILNYAFKIMFILISRLDNFFVYI